jgi:bacterioferritin-associated ferredoxin
MIVCICHRVSDRDIAREVHAGCGSFEAMQDQLRVGTACGACLEHAQSCFGEHAGEGDCGACPGAARCGAVALAL